MKENAMKRPVSLILILTFFVLCLTGCGNSGYTLSPLKINSSELDCEIFLYYLAEVFPGNKSRDTRVSEATEKCIRYVAVNTTFEKSGLTMTDDEITTAMEEANTLWNMFGKYYRTIGVSKATFVKIHISGKYTEKLRTAFYGKGGTEEISDAYLRGALKEYFVAYKTIAVPMYTKDYYGNNIPFTAEQKEELRHKMSEGASKLKAGQNIESVASAISVDYPLAECSYSNIISGTDDHSVSVEFLDAVRAMEENTAGSIEMEDTLYIVYRVDILGDVSILEEKRDDCLKLLSEGPLQSKITEMCNGYTAVRNMDAVNKYYKIIEQARLNR